ncbi:Peptidoglycan/xylan/chitin deacetylase, PgdA/CDA1 family [Clostridium collagenovorans DSM 3089]|uniref:Peptidoglycan/xylan/chitin deacetylase, PgdA/CDA1 family n=1 Tax=Clostridium collagenovorans DSM 3089 TaxID=1121306 RepID=A0A1M5XGD0_9CLOT|nr:polysaccharide deacetylase family protein [Clostridium collagenovorans]SHH98588.1 Peptidoglycan/xylan/chitin deacetylase, PgdA/CDA1 family [Clostridium collagenovorans DSM 3089]
MIKVILIIGMGFYLYSLLPTLYYRIKIRKSIENGKHNKSILLSFDDGPSIEYTNKLLDLLKRYNIKATFFVVAKSAKESPDIINRILKAGHSLGIHSLEHKNAMFHGYFYTKNDFKETISIVNSFKSNVVYYRPPWGQVNLFTLYYVKKYNLKLVLWSVMVGDWSKYTTVEDIESRLLNWTKSGSVICLHDGRGAMGAPLRTIQALEEVIPKLLEKGFKFLNIDDFYMENNKA